MKKQLTYLFSELRRHPPASYDAQVIKKTLRTIFLKAGGEALGVLKNQEDPEMLFDFSAFFSEIIANHKTRYYLDQLRMIIDRFKTYEHYPIILERYNAITDIFYGVFLIPQYNFTINKALRDFTSIALDQSAKIILSNKDYISDSDQRYEKVAAKLTYIADDYYHYPPKMVVVDFRGPDELSRKYYDEHYYDWVEKDKRLFHGIAMVKTIRRYYYTLFEVVSAFVERNRDVYFLTSAGLVMDWKYISYLRYIGEIDMLPTDWDSVKIEIPEDFELED